MKESPKHTFVFQTASLLVATGRVGNPADAAKLALQILDASELAVQLHDLEEDTGRMRAAQRTELHMRQISACAEELRSKFGQTISEIPWQDRVSYSLRIRYAARSENVTRAKELIHEMERADYERSHNSPLPEEGYEIHRLEQEKETFSLIECVWLRERVDKFVADSTSERARKAAEARWAGKNEKNSANVVDTADAPKRSADGRFRPDGRKNRRDASDVRTRRPAEARRASSGKKSRISKSDTGHPPI